MIQFVVYDPRTGTVLQQCCMSEDAMNAMIASGLSIVVGVGYPGASVVDLTTKAISTPAPTAPAPSTTVTYLEFEALFTPAEQTAIMTAATSNPTLLQWLLRAAGSGSIDLSLPETKAGLDMLVSASLITADRETAILSNTPP